MGYSLVDNVINQQKYGEIDAAFESVLEYALEADEHTISTEQRDKLPDSAFGIPKERKYPLYVKGDPKATRALCTKAIQFFHYAIEPRRKELASNIVKVIVREKLDIKINPNSKICDYTQVPENLLSKKAEYTPQDKK